jgi:hypothetical protein
LRDGVPLEVYVSKFAHIRFEPSGMTNDPDIRAAKPIVDYIFRWMGKKFLTVDQQEEIGILSAEVRARLAEGYRSGGDVLHLWRRRWRWHRPGRPRSSAIALAILDPELPKYAPHLVALRAHVPPKVAPF